MIILNESDSTTDEYMDTSIIMLSELETKISNAIEDDIIRPNGYSRNLRLQIADLWKTLNNLSIKEGLINHDY